MIVYVHGPDRAPLKEVLGGQYNYREGGEASVAAGRLRPQEKIRIRAPKK